MTRILTLNRTPRLEDQIRACRQGNQQAMRWVFDQFAPKMLGVCRRYLQRIDLAEEAMSGGFTRAFLNLNTLRDDVRFEFWLKSIIVRECIDTIRREKRHWFEDEVHLLPGEKGLYDVHSQLHAEDLLRIIDTLPPGYRIVFNLFAIEGYSHQEIADMLSVSESTSKTQYKKAKEALRLKMHDLHPNTASYGSL